MPRADTVLYGSVLTMDPARPRAHGVALAGGRVVAVGEPADLHDAAGRGATVLDFGSACIMPGFHDAHLHLTRHGLELDYLDLSATTSLASAAELLRRRAAGEGDWVIATGLGLQRWGLATIGAEERATLEAAAAGRKVLVHSQDHHSAWASAAALTAAGVSAATGGGEGGAVIRDEGGEPTGLLLEHAVDLVEGAVPAPTREALRAALVRAGRHLASLGITTVHHMAAEGAALWRELALVASDDAYELRVWACIPQQDIEAAAAIGLATGQGGAGFRVGGAKFFADGALGSRTAWMLEPYAGTDGVGMAMDGPEVLRERVPLALAAGLTPVVHAIGDAATRATLDAFEATRAQWLAAGLRPRLEHAQHMHPVDVARAGRLGVVASMQPVHLTFDIASIKALLPDRLERAYPLRSLAAAGAVLAFGSDTPVAPPGVFDGLRAACRRTDAAGRRLPATEAISPDAALAAYTTGAAWAIGAEGRSGALKVGYDADLVVLDHDPLVSLDGLQVVATMKGGVFTHGGPG